MARYKYTEESGTTFKINTADHCDALESENEVRQILDDLGELLGHSKFDDTYPADATSGGDIDIRRVTTKSAVANLTTAEAGFVKVSAAAGYSLTLPTAVGNKLTYIFVKTDANANLITIDGDGTETINGSLTYTDLNYQYAYVAIRSDNANWYVLYSSAGAGGDTLPVVDTTGIAKGSVDATKIVRFEVDGLTTGTTRVLTVPDKDITIADNADLAAKAPIASPVFTGAVTIPTPFTLGAVSVLPTGTELNFVDGVTSAIQTQLNAKLANIVEDTTPQLGGDLDAQANHIGFTQQTITYNVTTTTVDWGAGNKATVTLTGNVGTMAFTNPAKASNLLLKIVQDATGSRLVTAWDADIKWVGGTAPTLTTTANAIDVISFYWDGTNYFGVASLAFA